MPTFKITLAYDGAEFAGWQRQPERRTVQGELERAWQSVTGEAVRMTAASRTDAGVHAAGQVVSVDSATRLDPQTLVGALNARLPDDAGVRTVEIAPDGFHATYAAKRKRYRYSFYNDRRRPIFCRSYAWHVPTPLDVRAMNAAAQHLTGTHDFASFESVGSERESTVRTIFAASVARSEGSSASSQPNSEAASLIVFEVEGDGFLYNMVRAIAGTLVEVGRGSRPPEWVAEVIAACSRPAAGQTAPAQGLTLLQVMYGA